MAYEKQSWVDNTTPVDAEHLNHIEDGIAANAEDIAAVNADLTDKVKVNQHITIGDFGLSTPFTTAQLVAAMANAGGVQEYYGNVTTSTLTDNPATSGLLHIVTQMSSSTGNWRGLIELFPNTTDRLESVWVGRPTTNIESVDWYKVNLDPSSSIIDSGSIFDLTQSGVYYVRNAVTDKPTSNGGMYILSYYSSDYQVGLFISIDTTGNPYVQINGSWVYRLSTASYNSLDIPTDIAVEDEGEPDNQSLSDDE